MRCAYTGQPARHDLAAFRNKLRQQAHIFVIDRIDLLGAELAHFLATEIFPSPDDPPVVGLVSSAMMLL